MDLDQTKKSHTEIQFCVRQDPKFTLLIGPQRKSKKFHFPKKFTYLIKYKKLHVYDFLKKMHWSPRMPEKWV